MALVAGGLPETSSHISPLTLEFWLFSVSMLVMILKQHVTPISAIYGFHSDVIKLQSQNSEALRILIYTRLKINKK